MFQVTAAANTPQAAPGTTPLTFTPAVVNRIEIRVPDGMLGLAGLALNLGGQQAIPEQQGTYIVSNDEKISWDIAGYLNSGAWSATWYNTDQSFPHTWEVRFFLELIDLSTPTPALPAPLVLA